MTQGEKIEILRQSLAKLIESTLTNERQAQVAAALEALAKLQEIQ